MAHAEGLFSGRRQATPVVGSGIVGWVNGGGGKGTWCGRDERKTNGACATLWVCSKGAVMVGWSDPAKGCRAMGIDQSPRRIFPPLYTYCSVLYLHNKIIECWWSVLGLVTTNGTVPFKFALRVSITGSRFGILDNVEGVEV